MAGCPDAAKLAYSRIEKGDWVKIRAALSRLEKTVAEFQFALKQG